MVRFAATGETPASAGVDAAADGVPGEAPAVYEHAHEAGQVDGRLDATQPAPAG